jgi:hypothetical protein
MTWDAKTAAMAQHVDEGAPSGSGPPICTATLKSRKGEQCGFKARFRHPEHPDQHVCGVHHNILLKSTECTICLDLVQKQSKASQTLHCNHCFHVRCLRKWFGQRLTCPNCRTICVGDIVPETASLAVKIICLMRALPPLDEHTWFSSYMMYLMSRPETRALIVSPDDRTLLTELAMQCVGLGHFTTTLRLLQL